MADPVPSTKTGRSAKAVLQEAGEQAAAAVNAAADTAAAAAETTAGAAPAAAAEGFQAAAFDLPEMFRSLTDPNISQTRDFYARVKTATEDATTALGDTFETTRNGMLELNMKALDAAKANADAGFELARQLLAVNSVADAMQIQSTFLRERMEFLVGYAKDVQGTWTKVAQEAAEPAKSVVSKTVGEFRQVA